MGGGGGGCRCVVCNWGVEGRISLTVGDENLYRAEIGHTFQCTSTNQSWVVSVQARARMSACLCAPFLNTESLLSMNDIEICFTIA